MKKIFIHPKSADFYFNLAHSDGSRLGLAIVKHIVGLHGGESDFLLIIF